jgi:hypothetical protein
MNFVQRLLAAGAIFCAISTIPARAVELHVSREALQRTLQKQLFRGPGGRYYLKGSPQSACPVYAEDPRITFVQDRIVVRMKTHARLGKAVHGACLGIALSPTSEVSVTPEGEGETLGFRDARLEHVSENREINFLLAPFLSHTVPANMKVNAADLLRNALTDSTANSGYKVALDHLKIHSVQIEGDDVVIDADGVLSVR